MFVLKKSVYWTINYKRVWFGCLSTLVQLVPCCFMESSHHLNQCWLLYHYYLQFIHNINIVVNKRDLKCGLRYTDHFKQAFSKSQASFFRWTMSSSHMKSFCVIFPANRYIITALDWIVWRDRSKCCTSPNHTNQCLRGIQARGGQYLYK